MPRPEGRAFAAKGPHRVGVTWCHFIFPRKNMGVTWRRMASHGVIFPQTWTFLYFAEVSSLLSINPNSSKFGPDSPTFRPGPTGGSALVLVKGGASNSPIEGVGWKPGNPLDSLWVRQSSTLPSKSERQTGVSGGPWQRPRARATPHKITQKPTGPQENMSKAGTRLGQSICCKSQPVRSIMASYKSELQLVRHLGCFC